MAEEGKRSRFIGRVKAFLSDENRRVFERFLTRRGGLALMTVFNYSRVFYDLEGFLNHKRFVDVVEEDLERFLAHISTLKAPRTVALYKTCLKSFFRWLSQDTGRNPAAWIKVLAKETATKVTREDLLTVEEVEKLVEVADNIRDRALIMLLYETGVRLGELLSMRIKSVEIASNMGRISIVGKTGHRVIPLHMSLPHLQAWLEIHPRRDDPESPLWVSFKRGYFGKPMGATGVQKVLDTLAKRAGLRKRVFPHLFRHARATELATELREPVLRKWMGWAPSSRMPEVYLHLSAADVEEAAANMYGLAKPQKKAETILKPRQCPRCKALNPYDALYCSRCSLVLTMDAAFATMEKREKEIEELRQRLEELEKRHGKAELLHLYTERIRLRFLLSKTSPGRERDALENELQQVEKRISKLESFFTVDELAFIQTFGMTKKELDEYKKDVHKFDEGGFKVGDE